MIRLNLEVTDPSRADGPKLLALAALFTQLAQGSSAEQQRAALDTSSGRNERVVGVAPNVAVSHVAPQATLDAADNPAAGMPSPAEAFGTTMGNGVAGSVSASSPSHASTGAASTSASPASENGGHSAPAVSLPDPAVAFGNSAGNAGAVPPPPSGPQASSAATPQTSTPGAPAPSPESTPAAPPVPTPGAVSAPAASTATVPGVELDSEGLPWDANIHASTKAKLQNGTWKVKRGTGEAYLNERKAVLRAALAAGGNAGAPATPLPSASPVPAPGAGAPAPLPPVTGDAGNVQTPTPPPLPPITGGTAGSSPVTLQQIMPRVTAAITAGTLTVDSAAAIVHELSDGKINNVAMLAVAPALLPAFAARLDALGIPA
jgi:hypothetical protein